MSYYTHFTGHVPISKNIRKTKLNQLTTWLLIINNYKQRTLNLKKLFHNQMITERINAK